MRTWLLRRTRPLLLVAVLAVFGGLLLPETGTGWAIANALLRLVGGTILVVLLLAREAEDAGRVLPGRRGWPR